VYVDFCIEVFDFALFFGNPILMSASVRVIVFNTRRRGYGRYWREGCGLGSKEFWFLVEVRFVCPSKPADGVRFSPACIQQI
jgi:hypothetical protein